MVKVAIPEVVDEMTSGDVIRAILLAKPETRYFKEEALNYALRQVTFSCPLGNRIFATSCDGTSPEHSTGLETTLDFMEMAHHLDYTGDWQRMYLTKRGRQFSEQILREQYGENIVDRLRPFAEVVWAKAEEYR